MIYTFSSKYFSKVDYITMTTAAGKFERDWQILDLSELPAKQQVRTVKQIARGDTTSVLPMIVHFATKSWELLPPHTRAWNTKEEMIADGVAYTVTHVAKEFLHTFDKKKAANATFARNVGFDNVAGCGSSFSSYLYVLLQRFYITQETERLRAEKRWEGNTISLERDKVKIDNRWITSVEFYVTHVYKLPSHEEEIISRIDSVRHFLRVYYAATSNLRKYLIRWFLSTKVVRMKDGADYRSAKRELKKLAPLHNFTFDMAMFLISNDIARMETLQKVAFHEKALSVARTQNLFV